MTDSFFSSGSNALLVFIFMLSRSGNNEIETCISEKKNRKRMQYFLNYSNDSLRVEAAGGMTLETLVTKSSCSRVRVHVNEKS